MINSPTATYSFNEAIQRIFECLDHEEIKILAQVLEDEKYNYSTAYLNLIYHALKWQIEVIDEKIKKK